MTPRTSPIPEHRAWLLGWRLRRDPLSFFVEVNRKHGNAARFRVNGRWMYLFNDPEVTRDILVTQAQHFTKSPALAQAKAMLGDGLLTSEGDFHKRQRKLSQPAFHPSRVQWYTQSMVRHAEDTSARWRDGEQIDLHQDMMALTLRVVTETLFSASIDAEVNEIGESMDVLVNMFTRSRNPLAPILNKLPLPSNYRFLRARAHVWRTVERFVTEARSAGVDRGDLLSTLLRARDAAGDEAQLAADGSSAGGMTDMQLRDEIVTLFAAGHETTANAMTFALWLLANHSTVAERMQAEVDDILQNRSATPADLDALTYTRAVVSEAMRLYPPAWVLMRQAKTNVIVGPKKYELPAGSVSVVCQWISHRDPRWWPDHDQFIPERWLDAAAKESRPRWAYFPFGGGPRSCIGESFAWNEAVLILATLVRNWRFTGADPRPLKLIPTITLRPRDAVNVRLQRRIS